MLCILISLGMMTQQFIPMYAEENNSIEQVSKIGISESTISMSQNTFVYTSNEILLEVLRDVLEESNIIYYSCLFLDMSFFLNHGFLVMLFVRLVNKKSNEYDKNDGCYCVKMVIGYDLKCVEE